ncbi:MAG TPA: polynucleotide adenylyltransferase PcnB [Haliangium sp.]|nr:polynucleotide adenylyltransferase PcnB [Haliangium sp.]
MPLDPARIDPDADRVLRRLTRHGHKAYLVGGCVRDLLLARTPKDFDIATSATPNQIRDIFRNCRIIGRRFRLAHIFFGDKIIETSTFRANPRHEDENELLIRRDNVFGTATEDAQRRDFTINGLFYDVEAEQVIDYIGGIEDLEARLVRTIGDPDIRFREDPVRMLRAIKFAARLGFDIEDSTYAALVRHRDEIRKCSPVRVVEEVYRLLRGGAARRSVELLRQTSIDSVLSPRLAAMFGSASETRPGHRQDRPVAAPPENLDEEQAEWWATWQPKAQLEVSFLPESVLAQRRELAWRVLDLLDELAAQGRELSNSLLMAALLSPFVLDEMTQPGATPGDASVALGELARPLLEELAVARRDSEMVRQILQAQRRLVPSRRRRGRAGALARRDFFDDALAVYEIMARAQGQDTGNLSFWHDTHGSRADEAPEGDEGPEGDGGRRRRRGGRRRRRFLDDQMTAAPGR